MQANNQEYLKESTTINTYQLEQADDIKIKQETLQVRRKSYLDDDLGKSKSSRSS